MAASAQILPFPASRPTYDQPSVAVPANRGETSEGGGLPLSRLKTQYQNYIGAKWAENDEANEADRYFHSVQWTAEELAIDRKSVV